jgi:hypothetical protein
VFVASLFCEIDSAVCEKSSSYCFSLLLSEEVSSSRLALAIDSRGVRADFFWVVDADVAELLSEELDDVESSNFFSLYCSLLIFN